MEQSENRIGEVARRAGSASMRVIFETISLEQAPRAFLKEFSNLSEKACAHAIHATPQECAVWAK